MARPDIPTIPDDKINFFKEQLLRELSTMFEWKNLPPSIPVDYLEHNLIRHGYILCYYDNNIGVDVLRCTVTGYNRHDQPTQAQTFTPNTIFNNIQITRNLKRLSDLEFDKEKDGVLLTNMYTGGLGDVTMNNIVEHYATRLALAQQAFDTNLLWANVPYYFIVEDDDLRLSIEKMFSKVFTGKPYTIVDKKLLTANSDRTGVPTDIKFIGKELIDVINEIKMQFKQHVGFQTAGVDKAERVNTLEVTSNNQHTKTVLQVMLQQRQIFCETINHFLGLEASVDVVGCEDLNDPS